MLPRAPNADGQTSLPSDRKAYVRCLGLLGVVAGVEIGMQALYGPTFGPLEALVVGMRDV
jgi:hypothetical protein